MVTTTPTCVLVSLSAEGWSARRLDEPGDFAAWLPLGLGPEVSACEALERARRLFPGCLIALYTP